MLKLFASLFGKPAATKTFQATSASGSEPGPGERALLRHIADRSQTDPLIGAKIGSKEITQRLIEAMKSDHGVHVESLLCALGSLAGYSCQAALRAQAIARGLPETALMYRVQGSDGKTYFFGDELNRLLAESTYSVWSVAAGGAEAAGCSSLPDIKEIFEYTVSFLGQESFGIPRVPNQNSPHDLPINYVSALWPHLRPLIEKFCPDPEHWPLMLSLSIQQVLDLGKTVLDPGVGLKLVMESAVPMSKIEIDG